MTPERSIVEATRRQLGLRPVLLCGSRAIGDARAGSDFDVLVVLPGRLVPLALRRLRALSQSLAAELGAPVSVNPLPERTLRRQENLFVWKLRREARVLAAPDGFALDRPGPLRLSRLAAYSYLLTGVFYLLERLDPPTLARPQLPTELERGVEKALLHVAQVRLLREGRYESRLEHALLALGAHELDGLAEQARTRAGWHGVRRLVLSELATVERPLTGSAGTAVANARYAALAALRGRDRIAASLSTQRVDERLGDAAALLLHAVGPDGVVDAEAVARARASVPRPVCDAGSTWKSLRDALVREWPDAHPLSAL